MSLRAPHLLLPPFVVMMQSRLCHQPRPGVNNKPESCESRETWTEAGDLYPEQISLAFNSVSVSTLTLCLWTWHLTLETDAQYWMLRLHSVWYEATQGPIKRYLHQNNQLCLSISIISPITIQSWLPHILIHCIIVDTNTVYLTNNTCLAPHIIQSADHADVTFSSSSPLVTQGGITSVARTGPTICTSVHRLKWATWPFNNYCISISQVCISAS